MRWSALLLVPLFVVACDREPVAPDSAAEFAAADVGWTYEEGYNDYTADVPCLGERMHFTGPYWARFHMVENGSRTNLIVLAGPLPVYQGVGLTSGNVWLMKSTDYNGVGQANVWLTPLGEPTQVAVQIGARYDFVNQQTGEKLAWPFKAHIIRNAAGEVKTFYYVEPCTVK